MFSSAEHDLSGIMSGLCVLHCPPVSGEGEKCSLQIMSSITGADGMSHPSSLTWLLVYEGFPVLGSLPQTGTCVSWHTEGDGYCGMRNGAAPLATTSCPGTGGAHGHCPIPEGGHNRRSLSGCSGTYNGQSVRGLWSRGL